MSNVKKYTESELVAAVKADKADYLRVADSMRDLFLATLIKRNEDLGKMMALTQSDGTDLFTFRESNNTDSMTGQIRAHTVEELEQKIDGLAAYLKSQMGNYTDKRDVVWHTSARMFLGKPYADPYRKDKMLQIVKILPNMPQKAVDTSAVNAATMPD